MRDNATAGTTLVGAQVDLQTWRRLKEQAARNERSMAAEVRLALRKHLETAA